MTGGEVERITDPATIRNIDWSDHYETTTPRGATPMTDAAQDLSEREADANALEAYRAIVTTLEAEKEKWRIDAIGWETAPDATDKRLEQAEARVDQLTDLLTLRTEALNRTGATNDQMRAILARAWSVIDEWADFGGGRGWGELFDDIRAVLAEDES